MVEAVRSRASGYDSITREKGRARKAGDLTQIVPPSGIFWYFLISYLYLGEGDILLQIILYYTNTLYSGKPSEDGGVKQDTTALEW